MIYFDFREKTKKLEKSNFWFFCKNKNKSLQKALYTNFGLTYIDVFFDEESESDVIFDIKLTPTGLKSSFL